MTINGKKADVYMTIKESVSNGHRICSLELTEIRKPSDVQDGKPKLNELYHTSDGSEVNIAPSSEKSSQNTAATVKLSSVAEITDKDFISPVRNIELPPLPEKTLSLIGKTVKPVLLKENILQKNHNNHPELSTEES